MQVVKLVFDS